MGVQVAVAGASGYAGGELLRLLARHPDLELTTVSAGSNAGQPITSIHPNLTGHPAFDGQDFAPTSSATLGEAELIFMALPHSESAKLAEQLPAARIVDLSADFRLGDEDAWHQFYGNDVSYAGRWAYGLPELPSAPGQPSAKENIKKARTVAAPGCYATTSILALAPLLAAGLVEPADIVIVAASGTSGAGRVLQYNLLASEIMGSMSAYKVGGLHRHTPEIEQALSEATPGKDKVTLSFTPTLAPMPRGILATSTARLTEKARTTDATETLRKAFKTAYQNSPFVHLLPEGQWPATASVYGSNGAHVQVAADPHAGRAVVISTTDNLGKGAAGQAVQIANLMLGLPEAAGLTTHGVAP